MFTMTKKDKNKDKNTERLQKVLAHAGVASRRASEQIILEGRVTVNGRVVIELGTQVDPRRDAIRVDGKRLSQPEKSLVYIILNKPVGVVSAATDNMGRTTVVDLVRIPERVYPVGRLDLLSEGLILLTNDGELTQKITHPRYEIEKEYHVLVSGNPDTPTLIRWQRGGIEIEGKLTGPSTVDKLKVQRDNTWLKILLTEGRKREIRETANALGHSVKVLRRVRIGPINLGNLKPGKWRRLTPREIDRLKIMVNRKR